LIDSAYRDTLWELGGVADGYEVIKSLNVRGIRIFLGLKVMLQADFQS
jgi:hypothetical protein